MITNRDVLPNIPPLSVSYLSKLIKLKASFEVIPHAPV